MRVVEFSAEGIELAKFGSNGSGGKGEIGNPAGLTVSGENLYVTEEENSRVQEFSISSAHMGKFERQFDENGSGTGQSNKPYGITTEASTGDLYVSEVGSDRVQVFSSEGAFVTVFGSPGNGSAQLSGPKGIAIGSSGSIYVADMGNNRLEEWVNGPINVVSPEIKGVPGEGMTLTASAGTWEGTPAIAYQWQRCNGTGCENISGAEGESYVTKPIDVGDDLRVVVTAKSSPGTTQAASAPTAVIVTPIPFTFAYSSDLTECEGHGAFSEPLAVAADGHDHLWIANYQTNSIDELSEGGKCIRQFGSKGSELGQLDEPEGLTVDFEGNLWVADTGNHRLEEFNTEGEATTSEKLEYPCKGGKTCRAEPVAVAADGNDFWIRDFCDGLLEKWDREGHLLAVAETLEEEIPDGRLAIAPNGDVWTVSEFGTLEEYDGTTGEFLEEYGGFGRSPGHLREPEGAAFDSADILVGDDGNFRVDEFTTEGIFVTSFGEFGSGPGQFGSSFLNLTVGKAGEVWVTDSAHNRVEKWVPAVPTPTIEGVAEEGQTLTANVGSWPGGTNPTFTYQWQHCGLPDEEGEVPEPLEEETEECTNIEGATSAHYSLGSEDDGYRMRLVLTGKNALGSATRVSSQTSRVFPSEPFDEEEAGGEESAEGSAEAGSGSPDDVLEPPPCSPTHHVCGNWSFLDTHRAAEYAEAYGESVSPEYGEHPGTDCANYVSQLLHEGGMPMLAAYKHVRLDWWSRGPSIVAGGKLIAGEQTNSWDGSENLYYHLLQAGLARPLKRSETPEAGDVVFFHWSPDHKVKVGEPIKINHVGMIVAGNNHNQATEIYTSHTEDRRWSMSKQFKAIGAYLHSLNSHIAPSEDARGEWWQWYVLRPIHLGAYVP